MLTYREHEEIEVFWFSLLIFSFVRELSSNRREPDWILSRLSSYLISTKGLFGAFKKESLSIIF